LHLFIVVELQECGEKPMFHLQSQWSPKTHLLPVRSAWETSARKLRWEILRRNAPRIWRDFGSALPFQTRLTHTKPGLPLPNEHGSQVKDQGRRQCGHNKKKNSLSAYMWCIFTFRTRLVNYRNWWNRMLFIPKGARSVTG
jgi:hypothetical protein